MKFSLSLRAFAAVLASLISTGGLHAYGPSTLYTGIDPAPNYPRVIQLQFSGTHNGRMYATFEHAEVQAPNFRIFESNDSGETWKSLSALTDTQNGWGMRYQPFLYELPEAIGDMPAGTILCAGNSIPTDMSKTKIDLYKSTDQARTWTFVSSVASGGRANPDGNHDPVWEPFLLVADGKLICYYSDERDPEHNQKIVHQTSSDGVNWGEVIEDVALPTQTLRPGMPVVTRMSTGRYIMVYEVVGLPVTATFFQTSDDPTKWQSASQGTKISDGGAPFVATLADGTLVVSELDNDRLLVNSSNAAGAWKAMESPLAKGYSRCLLPLANGRLFLAVSIGNDVKYADTSVTPQ